MDREGEKSEGGERKHNHEKLERGCKISNNYVTLVGPKANLRVSHLGLF